MRKTTLLHAGLTMAIALPLAACGHDTSSDPSVATVVTGSQASSATPTASAAGRPQLRLDSTDAERWRMNQVWWVCLKDAGAPVVVMPVKSSQSRSIPGYQPGDVIPSFQGYLDTDPKFTEPRKKCIDKEPLEPPELDPKRNPHYADEYKNEIDCMRRAGLTVTTLKDPDGSDDFQVQSDMDGGDRDKLIHDCEMKAFAK
jgi:hypothetical protein